VSRSQRSRIAFVYLVVDLGGALVLAGIHAAGAPLLPGG